jgi:mono/diheme cytochrome c family protein
MFSRTVWPLACIFVFCLPLRPDDLGKEIYQQCAGCHGAKGQGSRNGPPLLAITKRKSLAKGGAPSDANLEKLIRQGAGTMPGFPHVEGADLRALISYLKKL